MFDLVLIKPSVLDDLLILSLFERLGKHVTDGTSADKLWSKDEAGNINTIP